MSWNLTLRQQNALRLALVFVLFEVLTTLAVVQSIVLVLLADALFAVLFMEIDV